MKPHNLRVLSVSTLYPSEVAAGRGLFVRNRLQSAATLCGLRLVVPISSTDLRGTHWAPRPEWIRDEALPVHYAKWRTLPGLGAFGPSLLSRQLWGLVTRSLEAEPADLLDAQFGYPDGPAVAAIAKRLRMPYCITLRGSEVLHAESGARRRMLQKAFRGAAFVLAVSERLLQFAISLGAAPARARCIPNGVDATLFHAQSRTVARCKWRAADGQILVAAAGNLIRLKGFHRLLEAARRLHGEGRRIKLVVAGSGGFEPAYEAELKGLPAQFGIERKVEFCGRLQQSELASLFSAADVFVLSSDREGCPNVVLEAMACGAPVVATDVGSAPELVSAPLCGVIVPPGDADALAVGLRTAVARDWDRDAISRWAHARSWKHVAQDLVEAWSGCLAR